MGISHHKQSRNPWKNPEGKSFAWCRQGFVPKSIMCTYIGMSPRWIAAFEPFITSSLNTNGLKALCSFQHGAFICVERQGPFKGHSRERERRHETYCSVKTGCPLPGPCSEYGVTRCGLCESLLLGTWKEHRAWITIPLDVRQQTYAHSVLPTRSKSHFPKSARLKCFWNLWRWTRHLDNKFGKASYIFMNWCRSKSKFVLLSFFLFLKNLTVTWWNESKQNATALIFKHAKRSKLERKCITFIMNLYQSIYQIKSSIFNQFIHYFISCLV